MERDGLDAAVAYIQAYVGRPLTFMEVCGTHTMAAARFGIRELLPDTVRLISGPGCPVCVTPVSYVDHALALATCDDVIITTFGDMMRVPGSDADDDDSPRTLNAVRAAGADVRVLYSPMAALALARENPAKEVVFLGVGFETTAPGLALTVKRASEKHVRNFSMLLSAKTIPAAMTLLATADDIGLDGFLLPGHVSAIIGTEIYRPFAEQHGLACAVAGFEPLEMLRGIAQLVRQVSEGKYRVENCYKGVVKQAGNPTAIAVLKEVFETSAASWRGIGEVADSGLRIRDAFKAFDASKKFTVALSEPKEPKGCRCGDVLKGLIRPEMCGLFGAACTPMSPRGACMVSSEGSCAASYNYGLSEG
jgi:hydrogenase expression/formation protein HypD